MAARSSSRAGSGAVTAMTVVEVTVVGAVVVGPVGVVLDDVLVVDDPAGAVVDDVLAGGVEAAGLPPHADKASAVATTAVRGWSTGHTVGTRGDRLVRRS